MTMIEDYANYELSKAIKAAGYNEPCFAKWAAEPDDKPALMGSTAFIFRNNDCQGRDAAAPFLWQVAKWLREKHHISVRVSYIAFHKVWFADWLNLDSGEFDDTDATFATYEEALSDGIAAALELIKKGE